MLYRSLLFAPAIDSKKTSKAFNQDADGVILDLEDAVAFNQKDSARHTASEFLSTPPEKPTFIRVNNPRSSFILQDLLSITGKNIHGIFLPKTEYAVDVLHVDWALSLLEKQHDLNEGSIELIPFIENALGIENAFDIASASPRVKRLAFGGNDFATDTGVSYSTTGEEFQYARARLVNASRAAGTEAPLDTVCPFIKDTELLKEDAKRAFRLGFQGKMLIHPNQVSPVNEIFTPTKEAIARARKIVEAFKQAESNGSGVIQVDGEMIELPIARRAQQILDIAREKGLEES